MTLCGWKLVRCTSVNLDVVLHLFAIRCAIIQCMFLVQSGCSALHEREAELLATTATAR
jgi:hypothetical protein